eukprot:CAMPEP_0185161136 /NCGR_PEP_ID=MMETSP1139-20130426/4556_1 /TAXON_ID=298111 /ORGANISM="Pavlova sp., Strain CCMP459" /LENGTH=414 /DNA_ID=CAMNT_0027726377 /DNA_START=67 /DNA_END=1311 /DNA_ORIENTATION=+
MGNAHTGGAGGAVEIDDDLLTRAGELLAEARDMSARKRTREEDLPAPAPMFSMPKPTGSERAGKDEYTSAVLSAATAYLNSGGKACKPIEAASAGSIGRKTTINVVEASDSSVDTESELVATPPLAVAEGSEADKAPAPAARLVVYKCRACGCGKRDHECHPTARAPTSSPAAGAAPATGGDQRLRPWTPAEDQVICSGVQELGFKWSTIASRLDRRTDNAVRNRWHRLEAARKWRAELEMCGEDKLMHGYKCGRCGQPKRGHTCPFGPDGQPTTPLLRDESETVIAGDGVMSDEAVSSPGVDVSIELSELFATLDACPAGEPDTAPAHLTDAAVTEFVDSIVIPEGLEDILSGTVSEEDHPQWDTHVTEDGAVWRETRPAAAAADTLTLSDGNWADEDVIAAALSDVDGGVSF